MGNPVLEKIAAIARELPGLPSVAQEALAHLSTPDANPAGLQAIMSRDPALTLKVLRMANSAYYRRGREITSLGDAIVLLGFKTIQSLVLSSAVQRVLNSAGALAPRLWEHCFTVAVACREISADAPGMGVEREEAFLAGLFHDVAKGVMAAQFPGIYSKPLSASEEREALGFDHAELGQVLLTKWQIPAVLTEGVGGHHGRSASPLSSLIRLGNLVSRPLAPGLSADDGEPANLKAVEIWGLTEDAIGGVRESIAPLIHEERSLSDG